MLRDETTHCPGRPFGEWEVARLVPARDLLRCQHGNRLHAKSSRTLSLAAGASASRTPGRAHAGRPFRSSGRAAVGLTLTRAKRRSRPGRCRVLVRFESDWVDDRILYWPESPLHKAAPLLREMTTAVRGSRPGSFGPARCAGRTRIRDRRRRTSARGPHARRRSRPGHVRSVARGRSEWWCRDWP